MATATELAVLISATADTSGVNSAVDGIKGKLGGLGGVAKAGGMAIAGGLAIGGAAAVGLGAAALKVGQTWDGAFDAMAIATGATGDELSGLQDSLKKVVGQTPADIGVVSEAMGTLAAATGETGAPLEFLTKQTVELARVTGGDTVATTQMATDVMKRWGMGTEEASYMLDSLLAVSQATGVEVQTLGDSLAASAPTLQAAGYNAEQAAALVGSLGKAGVDAAEVMPGLGKVMAGWMKDGKDPQLMLEETLGLMAGAPSVADAAKIGLDVFGSKGVLKVAAAAQAGSFSIGEMFGVIEDGSDSINTTADATDDFGEKLGTMKNKVMAALEPVGAAAMDAMNALVDALMPTIDKITQWIGTIDFSGIADKIGGVVSSIMGFIGGIDIAGIFGTISGAVSGVGETIGSIDWQGIFGQIMEVIGSIDFAGIFGSVQEVIGSVVGFLAGIDWMSLFGTLKGVLADVMSFVGPAFAALSSGVSVVLPILGALANIVINNVVPAIAKVIGFLAEHKTAVLVVAGVIAAFVGGPVVAIIGALVAIGVVVNKLKDFFAGLGDKLAEVGAAIAAKWDEIKAAIGEKVEAIKAALTEKWNAMTATITAAVENVRVMISSKWQAIKDYLTTKLSEIADEIQAKWEQATTIIRTAVENILTAIQDKWEDIRSAISDALDKIKDAIDKAWEEAKRIITKALDVLRDLIKREIEGWKKIVEKALEIAKWLWDVITGAVTKVKEAIGKLGRDAIDAGLAAWKAIVSNALKLGDWIGEKIDELSRTGSAILAKIKSVGAAIVDGLKQGIQDAWRNFTDWFAGIFGDPIAIAKRILGIGSPSRVFAEIGRDLAEGFAIGIEDGIPRVREAMGRLVDETMRLGQRTQLTDFGTATVGKYGFRFVKALDEKLATVRPEWSRVAGAEMEGGNEPVKMLARWLAEYIRDKGWGSAGLGGNTLAEWMRQAGFDEEVVRSYKNLHTMREGGHWATKEAFMLWKRRVMPRQGRGGGETGMGPQDYWGVKNMPESPSMPTPLGNLTDPGMWYNPNMPTTPPPSLTTPPIGVEPPRSGISIRVNNVIRIGQQTIEVLASEVQSEISRSATFAQPGA